MTAFPRQAAAAVALVTIVGAGVILNLNSPGGAGGGPTPSPSVAPSPTAPPTLAPPTVAPTLPPVIDTSDWTPFTSTLYGFPMAYPPDWRIDQRATRQWTTAEGWDFTSPALDTFVSPEGDIGVSVWAVAVDPNPDVEVGWEDIEAWIETLCTLTGNGPCTGIHDRVVPMCPDSDTECHPGAMIVPFDDSVAGFKGGGRGAVTAVVDGKAGTYWIVVSVWHRESFPGLARYGGGTRLMQAFLESMGAQMPSRGPVDHSYHH